MKTEDRHKNNKTAVFLEEEHAAPLRDMAATLDLYITRGVGTGKVGNIKALVLRLKEVYQRDPSAVLELLSEPPPSP